MASATYRVDGMTCAHCVSAVTEELTALAGVTDVTVELDAGGTSTVSIVGPVALTDKQVAEALGEAGYYRLADAPAATQHGLRGLQQPAAPTLPTGDTA